MRSWRRLSFLWVARTWGCERGGARPFISGVVVVPVVLLLLVMVPPLVLLLLPLPPVLPLPALLTPPTPPLPGSSLMWAPLWWRVGGVEGGGPPLFCCGCWGAACGGWG